MSEFNPGQIVKIINFKSQPEYNNQITVVLCASSEEEQKQMDEKQTYKLAWYPDFIFIKQKFLLKLDDSHKVNWTFMQSQDICLQKLTQLTQFGDFERSEDFIQKLEVQMAGGNFIQRIQFYQDQTLHKILNDVGSHCVYFCFFDFIGHELCIETYQGKARLFQSYVKDKIELSPGVFIQTGFTAREWSSEKLPQDLSPFMQDAHSQYGGGKELSYSQLNDLLLVFYSMQKQSIEIAKYMQNQIPERVKLKEFIWNENIKKMQEQKAPQQQTSQLEKSPIQTWAQHLLSIPEQVSVTFDKEGIIINSNDLFKGSQNEKFEIKLEAELAAPFIFLYQKVTGHTPMGHVFLKMLEFKHWEICFESDDQTGKPQAVGWAISTLTIPK